jgi:outer membrane protein assembly factor BamE (lipoprotein component of BamABCDE complex)
MRNRLTVLLLLSLLFFAACFAYFFWPIEGLVDNALSLAIEEDTEWAPKYSDSGFRRVRLGMSRAEVHTLLGPPLESWTRDDKRFYEEWTRSPSDTHYRRRYIVFENGTVVEVRAMVYFD